MADLLERQPFEQAEELWALTVLIILISAMVHGAAVSPVMRRLDEASTRDELVG